MEASWSIHLAPPFTSSTWYPAIEDQEALKKARSILLQAEAYDKNGETTAFGFSEMIPVCYGLKLSSGTDITRFYLYPASTGLLYVLPYLDATTSGTVPVATLPDSTISQLKELANAQQQALDSGIAYDQFCSQIQQASAIQVTPPSRFSVSYPEPITAPSLLEAGRADLLCARAPTPQEARRRWNEDDLSRDAYQITLTLSSRPDGPISALPTRRPILEERWGKSGLCSLRRFSPTHRRSGHLCGPGSGGMGGTAKGASEQSCPPTPEELAYFNDGSFFDNGTGNGGDAYLHFSIRNMFLTSQYDTPQDIDLFELFYCGSAQPSTPMSQEERQLVIDRGYHGTAPPCGCTKITRQEMDAVLLEHTGLTLEETRQVGLEQFTYLPEYDAYYHFHGDTNYTFPIFSQGFRQEI